MRKSRLAGLAACGIVFFLVGWALQKPAVAWATTHWWTRKPACPLSALEAEYIAGWRDLDTRAPVSMSSAPFSIRCSEPQPKIRCFTFENDSHSLLRNFVIYRSDMPNFYDAQTLVATATAGKKTQTEKVLALWELFANYYQNHIPLPYRGELLNPVSLFAVFGTAQCSEAAPVLQALCEMAGCRTRLVGLDWREGSSRIAHCAMEVCADGRWIYMDPDGHSIYRMADGRLASASDLIRDAGPVRRSVHAYYNAAVLADAFEKGKVTFSDDPKDPFRLARQQTDPAEYTPFHHFIRWDMLPGTKVTVFPEQSREFFQERPPAFCNALLQWTCRAQDFIGGDCRGVLENNTAVTPRGNALELQPMDPDKPASLLIPMTSPYLMVGGKVISRITSTETVQLDILPFVRGAFDVEDAWHPLAALNTEAMVPLDAVFQNMPTFGYALRIEVPPSGCTVHHLEVRTWLQRSSKTLPYLTQGENRFTLYSEESSPLAASSRNKPGIQTVVFDNGLKVTFSVKRSEL